MSIRIQHIRRGSKQQFAPPRYRPDYSNVGTLKINKVHSTYIQPLP